DEVVARGLARDRARRWADLEDLRLALLPFVPGTQTLAAPGLRAGALVLDWMLGALTALTVGLPQVLERLEVVGRLLTLGGIALYFAVLEAVWGATPGKWLLRLRVRDARSDDRPPWGHALARGGAFVLLLLGVPNALEMLVLALVERRKL